MKIKDLGIKLCLIGSGAGYPLKMSLSKVVENFREHQSRPKIRGTLHTTFSTFKNKVLVLMPVGLSVEKRWEFVIFLMKIIWSRVASGSVVTGALLSLLTMFADQPIQMLRSILNDPDIEIQIVEINDMDNEKPTISTRGNRIDDLEMKYQEIAWAGPSPGIDPFPFIVKEEIVREVESAEEYQLAIGSVLAQVWILLAKAVTAPDTARDSEQKRWLKYIQQRRADKDYRVEQKWLDIVRRRLAMDLPVRRFMVEILIEINRSSGLKGRIIEMIADIGTYVSETGMASFFLTIKYGIETRYPTLALNEFASDLKIMMNLMKYYEELGDKAPYLVLLEDSAQTRFAPGNYPLLWSFAMGVGTALDKAMNNLIYEKSFLEPSFFRLGQDTVMKMEGNIDRNMANELGLTESQINAVQSITKSDISVPTQSAPRLRGRLGETGAPIEGDTEILSLKQYHKELGKSENVSPAKPASHSQTMFTTGMTNIPKMPAMTSGRKAEDLAKDLAGILHRRPALMRSVVSTKDKDASSVSDVKSEMSDLDAIKA
ncbi:nucleocapsid protein [Jeilongvirus chaetodipodis]|uniref:Nucleocapsid protein n=1 Tax=Paramyxoviridae sp. TaxID=1663356 RepID=A0AC61TNW5_9MONO|nr:nucleocapsid protein [Paramyxoviridae sp.]